MPITVAYYWSRQKIRENKPFDAVARNGDIRHGTRPVGGSAKKWPENHLTNPRRCGILPELGRDERKKRSRRTYPYCTRRSFPKHWGVVYGSAFTGYLDN